MNEFEHSTRINALLAKLKAKEPKVREELIAHSLERLQRLSRKMFRKHPNLCTLEETDDIIDTESTDFCRNFVIFFYLGIDFLNLFLTFWLESFFFDKEHKCRVIHITCREIFCIITFYIKIILL